jgi:outer membrane protein OmpA-like peptidoglycan-associated protein
MKNILFAILSLLILLPGYLRAEHKKDLMKADYLYRNLAFHEAIPYYERVADTVADPLVFGRLGDCYRLTKAPQQAAVWYAKAVTYSTCPPELKLQYGRMLMMLGRYEEAIPWLEQYQAAVPGERRVANLIAGCRQAKDRAPGQGSGPVLLGFNTDGSEFGPALRKGMLVFTADTVLSLMGGKRDDWTGSPYYSIVSVSCTHNGQCAGDIKKAAANVNTRFHDGPAVFSADGNTMYFTRTNFREKFLSRGSVPGADGIVRLQIMTATGYDETSGKFSDIRQFPYNSPQYSTAHPSLSPSGNTLVFASDMPGGSGGTDLYLCTRDTQGSWSAPRNIGTAVNTEGDEMFPYLYDDRTLYFASDGHVGIGGLDVYRAVWNDAENSFGKPEPMGEPVNSSYDDMSLVLVDGGTAGYFASNRPAARNGDNIFFVNLKKTWLSLRIKDGITGKPLPGSAVVLSSGSDRQTVTSDQSGQVFAQLPLPGTYVAEASRAGYNAGTLQIPNPGAGDTIYRELALAPDFSMEYHAVVLDRATRRPIERPVLIWSKLGGRASDSVQLETGGVFRVSLEPDERYHVYALKDKYYGSEKIVSTAGVRPGSGNTVLYDTLYMKELKTGEVYEIENIYYDYDKADIREDAKPSLNRLLDLLGQYQAMQIQINSHTDCRGSESYNQRLSQARALSVIRYLQQRGIGKERLRHKGFGESKPVERCPACERCTEEQHQRNRRTEFQIIAM